MTPHGFRPRPRQDDRHWLIAGVAVLLSVMIHVALMVLFADWSLTGFTRVTEQGRAWLMPDRVPPMRVDTLRADPLQRADKRPGERDTPSRGPVEVGQQVTELSQTAGPALTAPPPIPREALAPGLPTFKEAPADRVDITPWVPRQEIAQIFDRTVQDEVAALPRREIPTVERVPQAPDIVPSIDMAGRRFGRDPEPPKPQRAAEVFDTKVSDGTVRTLSDEAVTAPSYLSRRTTEDRFALRPGERDGELSAGGLSASGMSRVSAKPPHKRSEEEKKPDAGQPPETPEARQTKAAQEAIETLQDLVDYLPIDDRLAVSLETYRDPEDPGRVYFRIGIQPRVDKPVPVLAKDIVWVQDVSASITEERLAFCRRGLAAALETMNPDDRFALIAFRETFASCFQGWVAVTPENKQKAQAFIGEMRASGQTDVFGSLQSLLKLPRDAKRPMIACVVTDGKPTFGMTESAKIIGAFSKLNGGLVSVYMFGTYSRANAYLLDMLTYCNRGSASVLQGNRWDIPGGMADLYEGLRNPVMADVGVVFDSASQSEVYPKRTANLYRDRPLELVGVCPDGTDELVFQLRGLAADKGYDSVFRLSLAQHAKLGSAAIKRDWARQKMFHLLGAYSRDPQPQVFAEMLKVHKLYDVDIPYETEWK